LVFSFKNNSPKLDWGHIIIHEIPVTMGFLHSSCGWCAFTGCFRGQLFTGRLPSSGFTGRLLRTCHIGIYTQRRRSITELTISRSTFRRHYSRTKRRTCQQINKPHNILEHANNYWKLEYHTALQMSNGCNLHGKHELQ